MAQVTRYPMVRHLRADATSYIQFFRKGRLLRSGRGLAFWFGPDGASISEIPMDDRELPFLIKGQSADFQDLAVQGSLIWRVSDPQTLGDRIDFSLDLSKGRLVGKPIDQVNSVLIALARGFALAYLQDLPVRDVLERGIAPLQQVMSDGLSGNPVLAEMGLALVGIGLSNIAPSSELARALQAPTFESLQQQADEAGFARRALAVEKERAIAENELNNKIELATQTRNLIAQEAENARTEAEAKAVGMRIAADAEAEQIRAIEQARVDMEKDRVGVYSDLAPAVLMAMAAREFAGKLETIDNLTVTPDMLAGFVSQIRNVVAGPAGPVRSGHD
ncbi:MAG: SPFH domain-containing protein [Pseudomonadota bacterium]